MLCLRILIRKKKIDEIEVMALVKKEVAIDVPNQAESLKFLPEAVWPAVKGLENIKMFVLDEADRMLDMGFVHDVRRILTKIPAKRQSLFFSATMPPEIQKLADTILVNPSMVEVAPVSSTADTIEQTIYFVEKNDKKHLLVKVFHCNGGHLKDSLASSRGLLTFTKRRLLHSNGRG
jgi:hypothetical protein